MSEEIEVAEELVGEAGGESKFPGEQGQYNDLEHRVTVLEDVVSRLISTSNFVHTKEETQRIQRGEAPFQ